MGQSVSYADFNSLVEMIHGLLFCFHFNFTVPSSVQPIKNNTITKGANVTLSCYASGTPPPIVSWIKVDSHQRIDGSELVLTHIYGSEAGEYRCEASNECGNASATTIIDAQCK